MTPPPSHRRPSRTPGREPLGPAPIATGTAARTGWTEAAIRHAVAAGDSERWGRGVVSAVDVPAPETPDRIVREQRLLRAAQASSLRCERAVISHLPAAVALGLPTVGRLTRPCLTVPSGTALRHLAGAHLHRATLREGELVTVDEHSVLNARRTIMDIAREHGVAAGVVAADFALNREMITLDELAAEYERCRGWPGRRHARTTLFSADGDAESPLESLSRLRLAAAGLPVPRLQVEFCDWDGEYITRSDFYWDDVGVVGEADGDVKYDSDGTTRTRQRITQAALERTGLEVVRWGWSDLFAFDETVRRIERASRRGARPGSPGRRWGIVLRRP